MGPPESGDLNEVIAKTLVVARCAIHVSPVEKKRGPAPIFFFFFPLFLLFQKRGSEREGRVCAFLFERRGLRGVILHYPTNATMLGVKAKKIVIDPRAATVYELQVCVPFGPAFNPLTL